MKISRTFLILLGILLLAFALRMFRLDFFSLRGDESFTVLFVQKPLAQMWRETLTIEPNPPLLYFLLRAWIALAGDGEFATRFFSAFFGVLCVPLVYRLARDLTPNPSPTKRGEHGTHGHIERTPNSSPAKRGEHETHGHIERTSNPSPARRGEHGTHGHIERTPNPSPTKRGEINGLTAAFLIAINPYQIWHSQDVRNYTMWPALSLLALIFFWQWYRRVDPWWLPSLWSPSLLSSSLWSPSLWSP
ncbi:MAG: glycosyltransferase family 39 protein, partial [Chloroflexi bacterium]|nr:glycosyltransferase family 39 protein [Chloroflexota bacterium]